MTNSPTQRDELLRLLAEGLLAAADGALARIWWIGPGDICAACPMREECPDRTRCLHLVRSAGTSQRIDGPFRRFPIGARRVGRVPQTMETWFANDDLAVLGLAERTWLMAHDVRAFAAAPILSEGRCLGVAAVFARAPLDPVRVRAIEAIAAIGGAALAAAGGAGRTPPPGTRAADPIQPADSAAATPRPATTDTEPTATGGADVMPLLRAWDDIERDVLARVLEHTEGRVSGPRGAAAILDLKPTTLQSRLKKLGLRRKSSLA